jgi:hypothetical protein
MSQFNSTPASRRRGTLHRCAILLGMLAFPCSLQAMMNANTAALASRAGSGPDNPASLCVALVAVATNSVAPAHGECRAPPFQLLTDIAWLAAHYCPPCDAAGVAPNRRCNR